MGFQAMQEEAAAARLAGDRRMAARRGGWRGGRRSTPRSCTGCRRCGGRVLTLAVRRWRCGWRGCAWGGCGYAAAAGARACDRVGGWRCGHHSPHCEAQQTCSRGAEPAARRRRRAVHPLPRNRCARVQRPHLDGRARHRAWRWRQANLSHDPPPS